MMSKPWLAFYEPHVPEHINYPNTVLPDVLRQTAQTYGERAAMLFKGAQISYA